MDTKGQKSQKTEGIPQLILTQTRQFLGKVSLPSQKMPKRAQKLHKSCPKFSPNTIQIEKILTVGISQSGGSKQSKWYTKGQKSQETDGTPRLVLPQTAQFFGKVSLPSLLSSFHFQLKGRFSWGCSSWGSLNSSAFVTYKGKKYIYLRSGRQGFWKAKQKLWITFKT